MRPRTRLGTWTLPARDERSHCAECERDRLEAAAEAPWRRHGYVACRNDHGNRDDRGAGQHDLDDVGPEGLSALGP